MVAYSFKGRFIAPIEAGTKRQTIRAVGKKRHARPGERMTMTSGDRFHPKPIGAAMCVSVDEITIDVAAGRIVLTCGVGASAERHSYERPDELDTFARLDGFADWPDMVAFWRKTHPGVDEFAGLCITWGESFTPANPPAGA